MALVIIEWFKNVWNSNKNSKLVRKQNKQIRKQLEEIEQYEIDLKYGKTKNEDNL